MSSAFARVGLGLLALTLGCEEATAAPAPVERPRVESAGTVVDVSLWREEVEGIGAAGADFTSVGDCVASLRRETPTAVIEGLDDLGYAAFFEQRCRSMQAVRDGDRDACDALTVSTARAGCLRRLAIVHGRPAVCPSVRVREGRDPTCVAWATRDPSMCAAATVADRPSCRAVFEGPEACASLPPGARSRCAAVAQRFGEVVEVTRPSRAPRGPRSFEVVARVHGETPIRIEGAFVDRGVALRPEGCHWRVSMIDPLQPTVGVGSDRAYAGLSLSVPPEASAGTSLPLDASAAVLTLVLPARGGLTSMSGASGEVVLRHFSAERGGAVRGEIRGRLRTGSDFVEVEGEFSTFVRDLEPLDSRCAG